MEQQSFPLLSLRASRNLQTLSKWVTKLSKGLCQSNFLSPPFKTCLSTGDLDSRTCFDVTKSYLNGQGLEYKKLKVVLIT